MLRLPLELHSVSVIADENEATAAFNRALAGCDAIASGAACALRHAVGVAVLRSRTTGAAVLRSRTTGAVLLHCIQGDGEAYYAVGARGLRKLFEHGAALTSD
jgi:hypothetical protein